MTNSRYQSFKPETFKFLEELANNNNRDWFNENKTPYKTNIGIQFLCKAAGVPF